MYRIIGADGVEYGPVSQDQIRQWIAEGRLNATSKAQPDGSNDWKQLRDLPEFASLLPGSSPPLPPITMPIGAATTTTSPQTNPLAGWSLGVGIASVTCCCPTVLAGVAAIILGAMALSQIKKNPNQGGHGMAIAGIVLGSVSLLGSVMSWLFFIVSRAGDPNNFPFRH